MTRSLLPTPAPSSPSSNSNPLSLSQLLQPFFNDFLDSLFASTDNTDPKASNMGSLEDEIAQQLQEMQRLALERLSQTKADGADHTRCPTCGERLERLSHGHPRTVRTRFGPITVSRSKGYCRRCEEWRYPADDLLGLDKNATASPGVAHDEALLVSKMPAEEAARVLKALTGRPADDSTMAREARRQGDRAQRERDRRDEQACHTQGRWQVTQQLRQELGTVPFTLVIEMDAWMIRERDGWGQGADAPGRWHWVYTATVFRLGERARTQSGRSMILSRGFVATRAGLDAFARQVYAEAVRQGLLLAQGALVVADGGLWIWKIAADRFPDARQRLDFYHAAEHLHAVAAELYGAGTPEARAWVEPLLHQLRHGGEGGVMETLEDLVEAAQGEQAEYFGREARYFAGNRERLDYRDGEVRGEPIGSGAVESTCRQFQCRFKRPGQFWSREGDESLLALECAWRNGWWGELFPGAGGNGGAGS